MKKLLVVLASLLVLVGCASAPAEIKLSSGDEIIFKGPDGNYTKEDLFEVLKLNPQNAIDSQLVKMIAEEKGITFDSFDKEAQDYVDLMSSYGLEESMISYYGSVQAFKELYQESLLEAAVVKSYIEDNFSKYASEDQPKEIQLVNFDDETIANKFIEDVNGGMSFEQAAIQNNFEGDCSSFISINSDDLIYEVKEYLYSTNELGLSPIIEAAKDEVLTDENAEQKNTYYIVNILESNADNIKEDYIALKTESMSLTTIMDKLFEPYDVEFYDQGLYKTMTSAHEVLK